MSRTLLDRKLSQLANLGWFAGLNAHHWREDLYRDTSGAVFNPAAGFSWNGTGGADRQDASFPRLDYDPTEQAWAVGPPQNAVRLSDWTVPHEEPAVVPAIDSTDQAWPVQPPAAAPFDPSVGFPWTVEQNFPDQTARAYDGQDGGLAPQPFAAAAFDPSTGFPWPPEAHLPDQTQRTYQPEDQAVALGPALNAVQLMVWPDAQADVPASQTYDPTEQAWPVQPPAFDPSVGFPWGVGDAQQDRSLQPVWADGQDGALGLVSPTDQALLGGVWNLDVQQDRSTAPLWYDPSEQSHAIQPPLDPTVLAALWQGADPSQDRSLQPVWYEPEPNSVWTATLPPIALVGGTPGGVASAAPIPSLSVASPLPLPSVGAPMPGGGASDPTPSGSATGPTPRGQAS